MRRGRRLGNLDRDATLLCADPGGSMLTLNVNGATQPVEAEATHRCFMCCATISGSTAPNSAAASASAAPAPCSWTTGRCSPASRRSRSPQAARSRPSRALAPSTIQALQHAFIDEQAAQCGFCIAGMIMRAQALLDEPRASEGDPQAHATTCAAAARTCASSAAMRAAQSEASPRQGDRQAEAMSSARPDRCRDARSCAAAARLS